VLDGVTLLKYWQYAPGGGAVGFVIEYLYSFVASHTSAVLRDVEASAIPHVGAL
jgi:hypothetical protein